MQGKSFPQNFPQKEEKNGKKYGVLKYVTNEDLKLLETNPEKFWCDVTEISNKAFHDYTRLTFIIIPGCVTKIGREVFSACKDLTEIRVALDNNKYNSEDGVLYNKDKTELLCCPARKTSITIPDCVRKIGEYAFFGCTGLTELAIPSSVTKIGGEAFSECNNLKEMIVSKRLVLNNSGAFEDFKEKLIVVETEKIKPDDYYLDLVKKSFITIDLFPVEKFSEGFVLKLKKAIYQQFEAEIEKIDVENKTQYNAIVEKMKHVKATLHDKQEKYKQYKKEEEIRNRAKDAQKNELKDRLNELFPEEDDDGKAE